MEGIPPLVTALAFGLPIYLPAMIVGIVVGLLLKRPVRACLATFLITQLLASGAWLMFGLNSELIVYLLLPSVTAAGFVVFWLWGRKHPAPAIAGVCAVAAVLLVGTAVAGTSDFMVANRLILAALGIFLTVAGIGVLTVHSSRRSAERISSNVEDPSGE